MMNIAQTQFIKLCRTLITFILFWIVIASHHIAAQTIENYINKPVAKVGVVVEGVAQQPGTDDLKNLLRVREGRPYSVSEARRSLLALYESGRVANARVEVQEDQAGAINVTFFVVPQARIGEVIFSGLVEVSEDEMRAKLSEMDRGLKFSEANVQRAAEQIYETMRDRGFYQTAVEPKVQSDPTGSTADVTFNITTGKPATVAAINLSGQFKISETALRTVMKMRAGVRFSRTQLNLDIQQLMQMHLAQHYLSAQIGPPDITYNDTENAITINLPVRTGPQFAVKVAGYEIGEKKLKQLLPLLREGGLDSTVLEDSVERIRGYLQEEGYFFAEVEAPPMPDLNADRAEIVFTATPNQRYRVTEIRLVGTDQLKLEDIAPSLQSKTAAYIQLPFFSPSYVRGITSEQAIRHDTDFILSQLRDQGFRRARMISVGRAVSETNDSLKLIFNIEEGPRSYVSEIAFKGNTLFSTDELREQIELKP
ncbi:MAG TPA: POTRA domain-containing protein, partial [Blastocatellia bacterium]|nr:POTRA domain-containing protein [Blastocatellia bacterium]